MNSASEPGGNIEDRREETGIEAEREDRNMEAQSDTCGKQKGEAEPCDSDKTEREKNRGRAYEMDSAGARDEDIATSAPETKSDEGKNKRKDKEGHDIVFKKKDVIRKRTHSVQSVLSTASLKSLGNMVGSNGGALSQSTMDQLRSNSVMQRSTSTNFKNFQSFIQAPVLSSISNLKTVEDGVEIGQRLPFSDSLKSKTARRELNACSPLEKPSGGEDTLADRDTILQQQKLTLNALKKLSLSPIPITNLDDSDMDAPRLQKIIAKQDDKPKNMDSYQPAQVDLSTFASLKRQPNIERRNVQPELPPNAKAALSSKKPLKVPDSATSLMKNTTDISADPRSQPVEPRNTSPVIPANLNSSSGKEQTNLKENSARVAQQTQEYHNQMRRNILNSVSSKKVTTQGALNPQHPSAVNNNLGAQNGIFNRCGGGVDRKNKAPRKQLQQIKGLRSPMYVPAVLRMTNVTNMLNNNSSNNVGSVQKVNEQSHLRLKEPLNNIDLALSQSLRSNSSQMIPSDVSIKSVDSSRTLASMDSNIPPSLMQQRNGYTPDRKYEDFLKQPPTRKHWLKDEAVLKCGIATCPKVFNFFERRHHCRKCGGIFCKEHTSHYLYINHLAQFTTGGRGTLSKVCDNCIREYNEFIKHEFGVDISNHSQPRTSTYANSLAVRDGSNDRSRMQNDARLSSRGIDLQYNAPVNSVHNNSNVNEQLVGSIPVNWSWSSF